MSLLDLLLGRPLASTEERAEQIGTAEGIPIFGLDALSSAAYGPEAALTLLIPLGLAGLSYILPVSLSIVTLLLIVFFSYRQTIEAYPSGGGSYTVAKENLGEFAGLLAAAALMIDYVLTAAVGISAGVGALVSAVPALHSRTLMLCLIALLLLTIVNLRGVREAGGIFMLPTYAFLFFMFLALAMGAFAAVTTGGHPQPVEAPPTPPHPVVAAASFWLLLKVFSSGCTAMTGVEAVSNGVKAFRDTKAAQRTLAVIIVALAAMLGGIAYLAKAYKIAATDPNGEHYQSVLSMLLAAVVGRSFVYYAGVASILLVLIFSANTAFAGFPRVCRFVAEDRYLPVSFANRGRRLVYSEGILILAFITGTLLTVFGGVTDKLIPLFAVGAFLAFTLSQSGMVVHWRRRGKERMGRNMAVNALGALATGLTVVVVIVAKFAEGAWITVVAIPAILILMYSVRRHYDRIGQRLGSNEPLNLENVRPPIVVVPLQQWSKMAQSALRVAVSLSHEIKVLHVSEEDRPDEICERWEEYTAGSFSAVAGEQMQVELVSLKSPYRFVISPIVDFVVRLADENPDRRVVAIVPVLIEDRWYNYFLHTQKAIVLKTSLEMKGNDRISVLDVPCYLRPTGQYANTKKA